MNKTMTSTDFAAAFMEGVKINASPISGVNYEDLAFTLAKLLHDSRAKLSEKDDKINLMDQIACDYMSHVRCVKCEQLYEMPCDLSEFDPEYAYCGKGGPSPCLP